VQLPMLDDDVTAGADFSPCRTWRYRLWREWNASKPHAMFLMLNPSTADETVNDPTVAKCQKWAREWGYGGITVCNLFAFRATDPGDMKAAADPVGPANDQAIVNCAITAGVIVCGWGVDGPHLGRDQHVVTMLQDHGFPLTCLKVTKHGHPHHPLYLRGDSVPIPYEPSKEGQQ